MIRILYVGSQNASQKGAIGTHTAGIITALNRNMDVHLSGVFTESAISRSLPNNSFFYSEFKAATKMGKLGKLISVFFYANFVRKLANNLGVEYIYVRFDPFFCLIASVLLRRHKLIIEYNDLFLSQVEFAATKGQWKNPFSRNLRRSKAYRGFVLFAERMSFARAHLVVTVTSALLAYCRRMGNNVNGVLIKNATDVSIPLSGFTRHRNSPVLKMAHVGTLTYWDGLAELFEAISLAYEKSPEFRCEVVVVGDGQMENELLSAVEKLRLEKIVWFYKSMPHSDAIEHLSHCDVVPVLKTIVDYGLSPIKFYEALGAGCHVLASDVPHMNEDIPDYVTNVSVPLDKEEIAEKLIKLHKSVETLRAAKPSVRQYAQLYHSWDSRVETLLNGVV